MGNERDTENKEIFEILEKFGLFSCSYHTTQTFYAMYLVSNSPELIMDLSANGNLIFFE